jgi:hypothetical protein
VPYRKDIERTIIPAVIAERFEGKLSAALLVVGRTSRKTKADNRGSGPLKRDAADIYRNKEGN